MNVVLKLVAVLALVASLSSIAIGWYLARDPDGERRRLLVSMHISAGIVLCLSTALLAFWVLTS